MNFFRIFGILLISTITFSLAYFILIPNYIPIFKNANHTAIELEMGNTPRQYKLFDENHTMIGLKMGNTTRQVKSFDKDNTAIGLGLGITTRKIKSLDAMLVKLPFFRDLLPSFCSTCSHGFKYNFFLAFDYNDPLLKKEHGRKFFQVAAEKYSSIHCKGKCKPLLHFIKCNSTGKPAIAQNDALMSAYRNNMDYLYMVNDDTIMQTANWTNTFINTLHDMYPSNLGMVGPTHRGGNTNILTYHFVHRTHVDIFSYFYPSIFGGWYADDWLSRIYEPNNVKKIPNVKVKHTMVLGQRYHENMKSHAFLRSEIDKAKLTIKLHLQKLNIDANEWFKPKKTNDKH